MKTKKAARRRTAEASRPVTLTMRPSFFKKADEIMAVTGEKISELTRRLIHEEYERRIVRPKQTPPAGLDANQRG